MVSMPVLLKSADYHFRMNEIDFGNTANKGSNS